MKTILVTGGAGFIGSCFVRRHIARHRTRIVNLDALTYAGNMDSIPIPSDEHVFVQGDIGDSELTSKLFAQYRPEAVVNFAAESHVDRSIDGPAIFVQTNVLGTTRLLDTTLEYYRSLADKDRNGFRFLHVSTDEVFGSLGTTGQFSESTAYAPNSPYSASKAASDMFVRAYRETYGLPTLITNCSNNYGPYQFPEKLIPLIILNAIAGKSLPVYGDGSNIRDWLFVDDHCAAIDAVLYQGSIGETYCVGGDSERSNLTVVQTLCDLVDELASPPHRPCRNLIRFVTDRPGHDHRYSIDASKIKQTLDWVPTVSFEAGLRTTVQWYLNNSEWISRVCSGVYRHERIGLTR